MLEYNEKVYKKVTDAGIAGIVLGIIIITVGITSGTLAIIYGARALNAKKHLID